MNLAKQGKGNSKTKDQKGSEILEPFFCYSVQIKDKERHEYYHDTEY